MADFDTPPMTDDERYEMTAAAEASLRHNRPRHLVVLGALVLAVGAVALLAAFSSKTSTDEKLASAQAELAKIRQLNADLEFVRTTARERPQDEDIYRTPPDFRSRLERLAEQAGLADSPPIPQQRSISVNGGQRVEWPYLVNDKSLGALLKWVRLAIEEIPGTFPHSIEITPQGEGWRMRVTFARYERT